MFAKIEPSGCLERYGLVQVRIAMYLEPGDYKYNDHHILAPIIPEEGYPGEVDAMGHPANMGDYQSWLNLLPKVWQTNPFHNHFIYGEPEITDAEIQAQMVFHLPNFYSAWRADKSIRSGWATETRIHPKRYDKEPNYATRKSRCVARAEEIKTIHTQIKTNGKGEIFPATAIDIGPGAVDRSNTGWAEYTVIDLANPANDTGSLDTFELWFNSTGSGVKVGTFYGSSTDYTSRDVETIGDVTSGSKQTFTGKDCSVTSGDFVGVYAAGGNIEWVELGGSGIYQKYGDQFGAGLQTYELYADDAISIYGSGETPAAATVTWASIVM